MIVAIHQPESFPWLGFFYKMYLADIFVLLDTVQFEKNNVQNRNKILKNGKADWLTVPIVHDLLETPIQKIQIEWDNPILRKHLTTLIHTYGGHPFFNDLFPEIKKIYDKKPKLLSDFNIALIMLMRDKLGIKNKILRASELSLSGKAVGGTEVCLEISKLLGADIFLSGMGAKTYLKEEMYKKEGISIQFLDFKHPTYFQKNTQEFIPYLSVIDLYFNHGPKSLDVLLGENTQSL